MSTDTEAAELEATLRALYESVTPPAARPHAAVPSATAFRNLGDPITAIRRRRLARRLLAAAVAVMVAVSAVLLVRTRVGTHASPAASASLSVYVLPAGEQLNCTIALSALSDPSATGFVSFDAGHVAFHPVTTTGNTYVPGLHRWVDTTPQMVSPDGNSYVTGGLDPSQPGIAVVDAGGTHAILKQANGYLSPLGFSPEGIVLLDTTPAASGPRETMPISLLDPHTGTVRALPLPVYPHVSAMESSMAGYQGGTDAVYLQVYDPASDVSVVSRYDLRDGVTTTWFDGRIDGAGAAQPVGETAAGQPIIQVATRDIEHIAPDARGGIDERTLVLTSPHNSEILNQGRIGDVGVADNLSPLSAIDGGDVWLAGDDGTLWRYQPGEGLRAMASIRTSASGAPGVSISGPCR